MISGSVSTVMQGGDYFYHKKKIIKLKFFKKFETGLNRLVLVWLGSVF
jgi:hypothetical protein